MIDPQNLWLFTLASAAIIVVPGPTVTIIVANSLRQGSRAGMLNILGTQLGLVLMFLALTAGFSTLIANASVVFDLIRYTGALYLAWLGIQLIRANGKSVTANSSASNMTSDQSLIVQGFLVIWSNPKALLFFGAFLPQFVDQSQPVTMQLVVLGSIFMLVGLVFDGAYAIAAGSAGNWFNATRIKWVEKFSGSCLLFGSIWLLSHGD